MKKGERLSGTPGFQFDGRRKVARFVVAVPGSGGRERRQKTVEDVSRAEALEEWKRFRAEVVAGRPATPKTLREYVAAEWENIVLRVTPRTRRGYETHLKHVILPELGDLPLERINAATVRDFAGRMAAGTVKVAEGRAPEGGYAPQTIIHALAILRRILRDAVDREVLATFPIRGRLPRLKVVPLKLEMSEEERAAFLAAFDDERGFRAHVAAEAARREAERLAAGVPTKRASAYFGVERRFGGSRLPEGEAVGEHFARFRAMRPVFVVALETGLRRGDLLALRWSSIDLAAGLIRVTMSKTKEEAVIPISSELRGALNELRFRAREGVVFPGLSYTTLERDFRIAKAVAGIGRRLRFHDLRHTFASRLASAGVSLQVIAKMLGHTTVQMSQRYARPDEDALRAAVSAVEMKVRMKVLGRIPANDRGIS